MKTKKEIQMFELTTLATKDNFELQLRHPVTEELLFADKDEQEPVIVGLFSPSSKEHRNAVNALQNKRMRKGFREKDKINIEELRQDGINFLVACSDYTKNLSYDGKPVKTADDFRAMYSDVSINWIREQVDAALGDVGNFMKE